VSIQASGRVFVLGAGASVFAGYPLAKDILSFIRNFQTRDATVRPMASRVLDKLNNAEQMFARRIRRDPNGTANLEELLTYLELYGSFPGTSFDTEPWSPADSDDVRRLITEKFQYHQWDLSASVWYASTPVDPLAADIDLVRRVSECWASLIKPGDVVITFNWDILHERILWPSRLWSYVDGYGFQCGGQGHNDDGTKVLMLKLHGSVNWVQRNPSEPVEEIAHLGDFFPGARDSHPRDSFSQAQTDSGRKLVLPTYLKDISSNKALLDLWTRAHGVVAMAKELFIIGYSLNPVDHPARLLFGTALSENAALGRVTVVSPDTTQWGSFLYQLNKEVESIPMKFEEWVCAAPNP
jgi:hypothetical protein